MPGFTNDKKTKKMNPYSMPGFTYVNVRNMPEAPRNNLFEIILNEVCELYNDSPEEVKRNRGTRKRQQVEIRQICITIFCRRHNCTLEIAGKFFDKDHATALHAIKTIKRLRDNNRLFRDKIALVLYGVVFTTNDAN
jgi:chromosomal replication initiation ATPase DnaA